jgi:hypothetical protein
LDFSVKAHLKKENVVKKKKKDEEEVTELRSRIKKDQEVEKGSRMSMQDGWKQSNKSNQTWAV